jgi:capsular polysaccharide biosynthesis protein
LAEEKKTFVLYEYLHYFWQRKWLFIIIPLITAIVVTGAVYVLKHDKKYTGTGLVSSGGVSGLITNDAYVKGTYSNYKDLSDVFVSEKGIVKFTVKGNSQTAVQKDLHDIVTNYNEKLQDRAKIILDTSTDYVGTLKEREKTLSAAYKMYKRKIESTDITDQLTDLTDLATTTDDSLKETSERAYKISGDVKMFEQPKILSESVAPSKTYIKQGIAIGIVLGLVLTVALLMLLKYLDVARKYYQHD